jgi:hypothetical protein
MIANLREAILLTSMMLSLPWTNMAVADAGPSQQTLQRMDSVVALYVRAMEDLAADRLAKFGEHARGLTRALRGTHKHLRSAAGESNRALRRMVREALDALTLYTADYESGSWERIRAHLAALSKPFVRYVGRFRSAESRWRTYYCSMAKGAWLQARTETKPRNPYYGSQMLECGDRVRLIRHQAAQH